MITAENGTNDRAGMKALFVGPNPWLDGLLVAPAIVVFFFQVGRGLGNTGYVLYWIAAVVLLLRFRSRGYPVAATLLFLILLLWGGVSAALSVDPHSAYGAWAKYALLGSGYLLTWRLVRHVPHFSLPRTLAMIGAVGVLSFAFFAARYIFLSGSADFRPEIDIQGLVPAYLSPFVVYWILRTHPGKAGVSLVLAYLAGLSLLLVFSNSLTEVLVLAAALFVLAFAFIGNARALLSVLAGLALFFVTLIVFFDSAGAVLHQAPDRHAGWVSLLDELSSFRTRLWYQALTLPPPNAWLGVGPGNVDLYPPVVISETHVVRHLHNLLLDCWYEIGFVGLAAYLAFYAVQIRAMKHGIRDYHPRERGVMYAAVAGILVAAMLDQSYRSQHVALFVPFLFALYSREPAPAPEGSASRKTPVRPA